MDVFNSDRDEVMDRARKAGVGFILTVGCELESSRAAVQLAEHYPEVFAAVGFHPHDVKEMRGGDSKILAELCQHPKVVAIGEIGLDFYRDLSPRKVQFQVFQQHLQLAERLNLPVMVHCRNAHEEMLKILSNWAKFSAGDQPLGVIHCFSGDVRQAEQYLRLGFLISLGGPVTYPGSRRASEVAQKVPQEKLLVETDCPLLAPQSHRGKRNEPSYLPEIVERIAQVREVSPESVAEETTRNALGVFRISHL